MGGGTKHGAVTAAALLLSAGASQAQAAEIISVPLSSVLASGGSYSGSFDISGFLASGSDQFKLTSASVEITGYSPYASTYSYISGYYTQLAGYYIAGYYSYSCGWSTCYSPYYLPYYTNVPTYASADGYQDSLTVDLGEGFGAGANANQGGSYPNYYGSIVALANLTETDLFTSNGSGLINYTVLANTNSSVTLGSAKLTFSLEKVEGAVPEPTTWAMMVVGFGAVGGAMRAGRARRTRKVAAPA